MAEENEEKPEEAAKAETEAAPATEQEAPAEAKDAAADEAPAEAKEAPAETAEAAAGEEAKPAEEGATPDQGGGEQAKEGEKKRERTAADVLLELDGGEDPSQQKVLKAKGSKNVHNGIVHVKATFNNTMVTVTDPRGNVIGWSSSGKMGFRGSRKSTAYAAQVVAQDACRQAMGHGLKEAEVRVKGPGSGRESAVRAVQGLGIEVRSIRDVTPIPHNGCRPKKARRV